MSVLFVERAGSWWRDGRVSRWAGYVVGELEDEFRLLCSRQPLLLVTAGDELFASFYRFICSM
jgi:hypothetical protein